MTGFYFTGQRVAYEWLEQALENPHLKIEMWGTLIC